MPTPKSKTDYKTYIEKYDAYSFDAATIKDLWSLLKTFSKNEARLTIKITLEENNIVEASDPDVLFQDPYVKYKYIKSIEISTSNYDGGSFSLASIGLRENSGWTMPIDITISGERDLSTTLRSNIEDIINGRRLWYARFMLPDDYAYHLLMLIVLIGAMATAVSFFHKYYGPVNSQDNILLVIVEALVFTGLLLFGKRLLFPSMSFEIGKSAQRATRAASLRRFVFGGILLALIVGVISALIANRI